MDKSEVRLKTAGQMKLNQTTPVLADRQMHLWESGYIDGMDEALAVMEEAKMWSRGGKYKWKDRI